MKDEVYVIRRNGKRFDKTGPKIAYLPKGAAKEVITVESERIAESNYDGYWYELSREEREAKIDEVRKEFEIASHIPKSNRSLRVLYLSRRGKNSPEMSQGEIIENAVGNEI